MSYIAGLICAYVLAALVVIWISCRMFCKEKHKSEAFQYTISDLRKKNYQIAQDIENDNKETKVVAGVIILPNLKTRNVDDSYDKRPDYPEESLGRMQPRTDQLIQIFDDNTLEADERKCVGFDLDSTTPYHSNG